MMVFSAVRLMAFRLQDRYGTIFNKTRGNSHQRTSKGARLAGDCSDLSVAGAIDPHVASFPQRVSVIGPLVPEASLVSQPMGPAA